jgi:hypothetical protein
MICDNFIAMMWQIQGGILASGAALGRSSRVRASGLAALLSHSRAMVATGTLRDHFGFSMPPGNLRVALFCNLVCL